MCATIFQMISLKYPYIDWYFELSSVYFKIYIDTSSGVERAIILFWDKLFVIWFPQVKLLMQHFFIFFFLREDGNFWRSGLTFTSVPLTDGISLNIPFWAFGIGWFTVKSIHCDGWVFRLLAESNKREKCLTRIYTSVESQDSTSEK